MFHLVRIVLRSNSMRALVFLITLAALPAHATIYGEDDIRPWSQSPPALRALSRSVALMAPNTALIRREDGRYDLDTVPLSESWGLCADEKGADAPSLYTGCTGFLVAEDLLLTAGHCSVNSDIAEHDNNAFCSTFTWIFDVNDGTAKDPTKNIDPDAVFECAEIVKAKHMFDFIRRVGEESELNYKEDWSLVRLKRKTGRPALPLAARDPLPGENLTMLGHPLAMPLMSSKGRVLRDGPFAFTTNLDGFGGNSGSPILNDKGEVTGILVRGFPEDTYPDSKGQCARINHCDDSAMNCQLNDPIYPQGDQGQKINAEIRSLISQQTGAGTSAPAPLPKAFGGF